jgi:hypothetical protein
MYCVSLFIGDPVELVAQLRRASNRVATGLPHSSAQNPVFQTSPEKMSLIFAFRQGFRGADGVN